MNIEFDFAQVVNLIVNLVVMSLMGARLYYGLRAEIRSNAQEVTALKDQVTELKSEVARRRDVEHLVVEKQEAHRHIDERLHDHEARIRILERVH